MNIRKSVLAILALGSTTAFAGTMGPVCSAVNVTVPCENTAWDIGGQALYLKPFYNNGDFSAINIGSRTGEGKRIYSATDLKLNWGFRLEASRHYGTGNDVNVNWIDWRNSNSLVLQPPAGRLALPDGGVGGTTQSSYYMGGGFDSVNVEFGKHVDFDEKNNIRFHAGIQYAYITTQQSVENVTSGNPPDYAFYDGTTNVTGNYRYGGTGPRLGADMTYNVWGDLAFYGNFAGALLVGKTQYFNNAEYTDTTRPVKSSFTIMVPELEAKLGANYKYNTAKGDIIFDVGYFITNYFNPLHDSDLDLVSTAQYRYNYNFGLNGLYFGAKWVY